MRIYECICRRAVHVGNESVLVIVVVVESAFDPCEQLSDVGVQQICVDRDRDGNGLGVVGKAGRLEQASLARKEEE